MDELAAYERRLRRAGLPLLIEDYSAYEDIFTRAAPLLALVTAAGNALLLALIYGIFGNGLLSIVRWAGGRVVAQLAASPVLLTCAVPVLLIFMIVLAPQAIAGQAWLSVELVKVSGALAAFSCLYYAIAVLTEASYREEFLDDVETSLRETFADRARYLALRAERRVAA